jgi:hypothetical protein
VRYHLHQARQTLRDALQIFHRKEA